MIVGINIGNSTTCIGMFKEGSGELSLYIKIPNKELGDIKPYLPRSKIDSVIIASVVPEKNEVFSRVVQGFYGIMPKFIDSSLIKGAYPGLGADRVANLIGGRELLGLPVCVIDFGTATTIDVLFKGNPDRHLPIVLGLRTLVPRFDGEYGGGIILTGVQLGLQSLHRNTALLPLFPIGMVREPFLLGKSTEECIESGAYWGEIHRIQGLIDKIKESINPKFVCTGGMGEVFAKSLSLKYEPRLTLWGLYFIWERKNS